MIKNQKSAYTLLETAMLIVVLGAFLRLAIPNYLEIRERLADATAQSDFNKIKGILREMLSENKHQDMLFMLNQDSQSMLPQPLSKVQIQEGVRINYAIRMTFPGHFDLMALEAMHIDGKHLFRLLEINDKGMEQIIRKRA